MTAERALVATRDVAEAARHINLIVAAGPLDSLTIQRVPLSDDAASSFREFAVASVPAGNVRLRSFDEAYKPDDDELFYLPLHEIPEIAALVDLLQSVGDAEVFTDDDSFVDALRMYALVLSKTARSSVVFLRPFSAKQELSRGAKFALMMHRGSYDRVRQRLFLFDQDFECFAFDGYLFFRSAHVLHGLFKYYERLRDNAERALSVILPRVPVLNADAFRAACTGQLQMMSKLASIARKPYLKSVTMADIKKTIQHFGLAVRTEGRGTDEALVFEPAPAKRWLILKLLDDDYLGSVMTKLKYEANSKLAMP